MIGTRPAALILLCAVVSSSPTTSGTETVRVPSGNWEFVMGGAGPVPFGVGSAGVRPSGTGPTGVGLVRVEPVGPLVGGGRDVPVGVTSGCGLVVGLAGVKAEIGSALNVLPLTR